MWEFAPGSPWKTIFGGAVMGARLRGAGWSSQLAAVATVLQHLPGDFEVVGRIDAERHRLHDGDVDAHAGLERAQLLELLAPLEPRWRQAHEPLQRSAPIGVKPDVVIERPVPGGRGRAGEVERAQALC